VRVQSKGRWLSLAVAALRPRYRRAGAPLPSRIALEVGPFPKSPVEIQWGGWVGPPFTAFPHIIVIASSLRRPDKVLAVLIHELCHAARPDLAERSVEFAALLSALGGWPARGLPHTIRANNLLLKRLGAWPLKG
jgi:Zn-dependent protease with chaperone function